MIYDNDYRNADGPDYLALRMEVPVWVQQKYRRAIITIIIIIIIIIIVTITIVIVIIKLQQTCVKKAKGGSEVQCFQ